MIKETYKLNDSVKNQIKMEEIYRSEIRQSISSKNENKVLDFLNSPLGIWILSTIVIGIITFGYKKYKEKRKIVVENNLKLSRITSEIEFRIKHVDRVMINARKNLRRYYSSQTTTIFDLFDISVTIVHITVIFDLGGIFNIPSDKNVRCTLFKIFNYNIEHLPFKSSFKYSEFATLSIIDLIAAKNKLTKSKQLNNYSSLNEIEDRYSQHKESVVSKLRERYGISDLSINKTINRVEDLDNNVDLFNIWFQEIDTYWIRFKEEFGF